MVMALPVAVNAVVPAGAPISRLPVPQMRRPFSRFYASKCVPFFPPPPPLSTTAIIAFLP